MSTQSTPNREARELLGLSQQHAAARANVSLASWRRWEADPKSVSDSIAHACELVLAVRRIDIDIAAAWKSDGRMTPRQAAAIICTLNWWADMDLEEWLRDRTTPLHEVAPFSYFDVRVMILVGENAAFAAAARDRCRAVADEIQSGTLPFDRDGCYFDELLIGAALCEAPSQLDDDLGVGAGIPPQTGTKIDDDDEWDAFELGDDDWNLVADTFDDAARWGDWEVPVRDGHEVLPYLLANRHPYGWFDKVTPRDSLTEVIQLLTQPIESGTASD
jgi:transcriptional regulator with XRE-family HTH domain